MDTRWVGIRAEPSDEQAGFMWFARTVRTERTLATASRLASAASQRFGEHHSRWQNAIAAAAR
jgi:hypothetical protein